MTGLPILDAETQTLHVGRSWAGHAIEDTCPCEKAPCGLAVSGHEGCPEHGARWAKTIRQGHRADQCTQMLVMVDEFAFILASVPPAREPSAATKTCAEFASDVARQSRECPIPSEGTVIGQ